MEREMRFGIQGLPRTRYPMPVEVARVLWLLPGVRWLCLFALIVSVFLAGFVTGAGLEETRHRVEVTPAAVLAGYRMGLEQGRLQAQEPVNGQGTISRTGRPGKDATDGTTEGNN